MLGPAAERLGPRLERTLIFGQIAAKQHAQIRVNGAFPNDTEDHAIRRHKFLYREALLGNLVDGIAIEFRSLFLNDSQGCSVPCDRVFVLPERRVSKGRKRQKPDREHESRLR